MRLKHTARQCDDTPFPSARNKYAKYMKMKPGPVCYLAVLCAPAAVPQTPIICFTIKEIRLPSSRNQRHVGL
jgi:hypothetical protein